MATMAAVGLGTAWSLVALGMTGHLVTARLKRWGSVVGGIVLILAGLATALRGTEAYHRLLGCPPAAGQASPAAPPCCKGE
jgi:sulfite exporter TauE/SafE